MAPITSPPMLPGILILNAKYFPDSETTGNKVGATSIAFAVAHVLQDAELFAGMILYQRCEDLGRPRITFQVKMAVPCVVLCFNFEMDHSSIRNAIGSAAEMLLIATQLALQPVILYHQTDTLLVYHPEWLPGCVTHHGPVCDEFVKHFSTEQAAIAFGSHVKAEHLRKHQLIGLNHLRQSKNMFVLQQSSLQRRYLMRHDIDADRIHKITPPINVSKLHRSDLATTHPEIAAFVRAPPALLLFTAVARLDFFKNVELLVDAGVELLRRGFEVKVLVAGGDDQEQYRRVEIRERIPVEVISSFMVVPKLPKDGLRALFDLVGDSGFFICTSRYETLGITPLEAALSCIPTLITDSTNVEASIYFPAECRFCPSIMKLADLVERFQMQGMSGRGQALRDCLQEQISPKNFKDSLLSAWAAVSRSTQTFQIGCTDDIKHIHGRETGTVQQALCFKVGELELDEGEARLRMADLA